MPISITFRNIFQKYFRWKYCTTPCESSASIRIALASTWPKLGPFEKSSIKIKYFQISEILIDIVTNGHNFAHGQASVILKWALDWQRVVQYFKIKYFWKILRNDVDIGIYTINTKVPRNVRKNSKKICLMLLRTSIKFFNEKIFNASWWNVT